MAFRFGLESILRLRQSLEHREELLLQKANLRVMQVRGQIEACLHQLEDRVTARQQQMQTGAFASFLHFDLCIDAAIHRRRHSLSEELQKLEVLRDQQREKYQKARRDRETLESIRSRELETHRTTMKRRDQRSLDDLILLRREFLRRG
jgi:flagellar export protein FliJ